MSGLPASIDPSRLADALLAGLLASDALVALKDAATGAYLWANGPMLEFLGCSADALSGRTDLDLLPQSDAMALRAADQRSIGAGTTVADSHCFERAGERFEMQAWRSVLSGAGAPPVILLVWRRDVRAQLDAELQQALAQIERQQVTLDRWREDMARSTDRPNALFRREHFDEHLRREAALSQREGRDFALVLIAIDRLEPLREQHGQAAAQRVEQTLSQLMRSNTRAMDALCQLGADRYAILFSGIGLAMAHTRVDQLRRACAAEVLVQDGASYRFEISAGVASYPHTSDTLAGLTQAAIRALNDARQRGGNRIALATIPLANLPEGGQR